MWFLFGQRLTFSFFALLLPLLAEVFVLALPLPLCSSLALLDTGPYRIDLFGSPLLGLGYSTLRLQLFRFPVQDKFIAYTLW